jgi:hypothetical protein
MSELNVQESPDCSTWPKSMYKKWKFEHKWLKRKMLSGQHRETLEAETYMSNEKLISEQMPMLIELQ